MANFEKQFLQNYRLTTAELLYRLPDHPMLLQSFLWQDYDIAPDFPALMKFLNFWEREIEGKLFSVKIASADIITPSDQRFYKGEITLN